MTITVAAWNIEKNGQSSTDIKQQKVSEFVDLCCKDGLASVLFLCEVHSARVDDYVNFMKSVYGKNYTIYAVPGGYSNAYILAVRTAEQFEVSHDVLRGLNRSVLLLRQGDFSLILAHFKSGQTGLTKDQLECAAEALEDISKGRWAVIGDMNWDFSKASQLSLPANAHGRTVWSDQTQAKGGILDWCLAGSGTAVSSIDNPQHFFKPEMIDMSGPDHRPIIFQLS